MRLAYILTFVITFLGKVVSFHAHLAYRARFSKMLFAKEENTDGERREIERWSNPKYPESELNRWWVDLGKPLLTIGSSGIQQSHVNSLCDLLSHHERVRIKLASDKLSSVLIAAELFKFDSLVNKAELLECRHRGFMIGRLNSRISV